MDALETLISTVSGSKLGDDARVRVTRSAAEELENREAVLVVAKEEADKLRSKPDPTPEEVARTRALVDVIVALSPAPETAPDPGENNPVPQPGAPEEQQPVSDDSRQLVSLSAIRNTGGTIVPSKQPVERFTAFASADIPDIAAGSAFNSKSEMGKAIAHRMRSLQSGRTKSTAGLVTYRANKTPDRPAVGPHMNEDQIGAVFADIANPTRLQRGSDGTFANSGFCSPSQIDYTFCPLPTNAGMVDLPSVTVERGGIRFPVMPSLEDLWGQIGNCYTEAEAMALDEKPCYEIPCPEFVEYRGNVCHVCIINSILTEYAYPELVANVVGTALAIWEHRMNARIIADMVAASIQVPAAAVVADTLGPLNAATATLLGSVELAAEQLRTQHMLGLSEVIEVVLPSWARGVMRSDLAKRNGVDLLAVTDADIDRYFAVRNVRIQWVRDWQSAPQTGVATDLGGSEWATTAAAPFAWPAEITFLAYPAGRFLLARDEILRITGQYDHDLLVQNKALALFAESFYLLVPRCYSSLAVTVPICANGVTGEQAAITCPAV